MNCPECSTQIEPGQNYCRDCGMELVAQPPSRVRAAGIAVLAMMFVGLLIGIGGKMFDMRWLAYLGLVILFTGAFIFAVYGFLRETRPRRHRSGRVQTPDLASPATLTVQKADTTNKLLPVSNDDHIPSVIDNTTELLETPAKR